MNIYFFTATILEWRKLLQDDDYKDIIINSLKYLVKDGRIKVHAYVIMPNHLHLVWKIVEPHILSDVQRDFLKFTAQKFKFKLIDDSS
jgi:REP element-mobilizing transposase RayT